MTLTHTKWTQQQAIINKLGGKGKEKNTKYIVNRKLKISMQ